MKSQIKYLIAACMASYVSLPSFYSSVRKRDLLPKDYQDEKILKAKLKRERKLKRELKK